MKSVMLRVTAALLFVIMLFSVLCLNVPASDDNTDAFVEPLTAAESVSPFYNIICLYDNQGKKVKLEYRMKNDDVKKYTNSKLMVFALSASQTVENILSGELEPVVVGAAPSNRATAEVPAVKLSARLARYVLALETADELVCSEPYFPATVSADIELPFKGVESDKASVAINSLAGIAVIDIDVDALTNGRSGYFYTAGDYTFTFNSTYLNTIDNSIQVCRGSGSKVLIRLYSENGAMLESLTYEAQRAVYAYVTFLIMRYSTDEYGGISGLILGKSEDTIVENAATYTQMLYAVAAGLADISAECSLVIPISDKYTVAEAFLEAVCETAKTWDGTAFKVMLESMRNPCGINNDYVNSFNDGNVSEPLTPGTQTNEYISSENIEELTALIDRLPDDFILPSVIYMWLLDDTIDSDAAVTAFLYNYHRLASFERAESFIVSLTIREEKAAIDESFYNTIRYINTGLNKDYIDNKKYPAYFGMDNWDSIIKAYEDERDNELNLSEKSLILSTPEGILGKYEYFDFSVASGRAGWYGGSGCSGIYSDKNNFGKPLSARMNTNGIDGNDGTFIIYNYKYTESFRYTDYIAMEFSVEADDASGIFDIEVALGNEGLLYEYSAKSFRSGEKHLVYLDVRELNEILTADYIRIGVKGKENTPSEYRLCLYSLRAESRDYDSARLYELIESERERLKGTTAITDGGLNQAAVLFVVCIVLITAVVMIMIARKKKQRKPTEN